MRWLAMVPTKPTNRDRKSERKKDGYGGRKLREDRRKEQQRDRKKDVQ